VQVGLSHSPVMALATQDEEKADAIVRRASAGAWPELTLHGNYTRLDEATVVEFGGQTIELGAEDTYSASLDFRQVLYDGGTVRAAIRAARLSRRRAAQRSGAACSALTRDVRLAFYDLLLAGSVVAVREQAVDQLEKLAAQTELRFEHRTVSEFEMLASKVKLANERPRLARARNDERVAQYGLKNLLGIHEIFEVDGSLQAAYKHAVREDTGGAAIDGRPDIRALETLLGMLELDVVAARGQYKPSLHAVASYFGGNSYGAMPGGSDIEWHWSAGATLEWPVLDGGYRGAVLREKRLNLRTAQTQLSALRMDAEFELDRARLDMNHAREVLKSATETVALAEKGLVIAGARLKSGAATYLEYSDASLELSAARIVRLQGMRDYLNAWARYRYAIGADAGLPEDEEEE